MPRKRKFIICSLSFLGIGLIIGFVLSMSFISGIVSILFIFVSIIFLGMKGGRKICQPNVK